MQPLAGVPLLMAEQGAPVVEINPQSTPLAEHNSPTLASCDGIAVIDRFNDLSHGACHHERTTMDQSRQRGQQLISALRASFASCGPGWGTVTGSGAEWRARLDGLVDGPPALGHSSAYLAR